MLFNSIRVSQVPPPGFSSMARITASAPDFFRAGVPSFNTEGCGAYTGP
jgi:hypothetical protein